MSVDLSKMVVCGSCDHRQRDEAGRRTLCASGNRYTQHAKQGGECPMGRFDQPQAGQPVTPSDYIKRPPMGHIPDDYEPTPTNATEGGCGCKK